MPSPFDPDISKANAASDRSAREGREKADRDESDMRRALGLGAGSSPRPQISGRGGETSLGDRPKRRFVTDGEVPVVLVHGRRDAGSAALPINRLEGLQSALQQERAAREAAERALAEAQAHLHDVQTKLGHAALECAEHADAARRATAALAEERLRVGQLEAELSDARSVSERRRTAAAPTAPDVLESDEPQPVQWWITPAKRTG